MKHWMIGAAACCVVGVAQAQEMELTWESYEKVRDYAARRDADKHYLSVPWRETVLDGMIAGQKEDKPILLWLYFGDGRGNC